MIFFYIILILQLIVKIFCNITNNISLSLAKLIIDSANESCISKDECFSKREKNTNKLVEVVENKNIFEIIPELRNKNETEAEEYFSKVLFPAAKAVYNNNDN